MPLLEDTPIPVSHGDLSAPSDPQLVERLLNWAQSFADLDIHNALPRSIFPLSLEFASRFHRAVLCRGEHTVVPDQFWEIIRSSIAPAELCFVIRTARFVASAHFVTMAHSLCITVWLISWPMALDVA
jgi:hypothetical protein